MLIEPLQTCLSLKPKLGKPKKYPKGATLSEFQKIFQDDPFCNWFGLDNPLMYAAHKTASGMSSIYRQIGIGCERLFQQILRDHLGLSEEATKWSYSYSNTDGKNQTRSLDGRILLQDIINVANQQRISTWMKDVCEQNGAQTLANNQLGTVFEVRQGYKSKDSKRQNADLANAAAAYKNSYLPCIIVFSQQMDEDLQKRYYDNGWMVLTGTVGNNDPLHSTYDFMSQVIGYDLADFFKRNSITLRDKINKVIRTLLDPEAK